MKLYTTTVIRMKHGEKCKIVNPNSMNYNKIAKFVNKSLSGIYYFQSEEDPDKFIPCFKDTDFIVLPTKQQLEYAIDLALDLKWPELFEELSEQIKNGHYN